MACLVSSAFVFLGRSGNFYLTNFRIDREIGRFRIGSESEDASTGKMVVRGYNFGVHATVAVPSTILRMASLHANESHANAISNRSRIQRRIQRSTIRLAAENLLSFMIPIASGTRPGHVLTSSLRHAIRTNDEQSNTPAKGVSTPARSVQRNGRGLHSSLSSLSNPKSLFTKSFDNALPTVDDLKLF